jgi:hypothetical protein
LIVKTEKKTKNQKVKTDAWHPWKKLPKETEITYVFAAVDERYGIFNLALRSKERLSHGALEKYMDEAKERVDQKGSPGLDEWAKRMEARGFRIVPCTAAILDDKRLTQVDCVPPPEGTGP